MKNIVRCILLSFTFFCALTLRESEAEARICLDSSWFSALSKLVTPAKNDPAMDAAKRKTTAPNYQRRPEPRMSPVQVQHLGDGVTVPVPRVARETDQELYEKSRGQLARQLSKPPPPKAKAPVRHTRVSRTSSSRSSSKPTFGGGSCGGICF